MGIILSSKNHSIDLGCMGFNRLRIKVAELTGEEIGEHYKKLSNAICLSGKEKKIFFDEYNKKISELADKHNIPHGILDFLYASDLEGEITYDKCEQIYKVIEDYDDKVLYGYIMQSNCAMFKDFKEIIKDCVNNKCSLEWS